MTSHNLNEWGPTVCWFPLTKNSSLDQIGITHKFTLYNVLLITQDFTSSNEVETRHRYSCPWKLILEATRHELIILNNTKKKTSLPIKTKNRQESAMLVFSNVKHLLRIFSPWRSITPFRYLNHQRLLSEKAFIVTRFQSSTAILRHYKMEANVLQWLVVHCFMIPIFVCHILPCSAPSLNQCSLIVDWTPSIKLSGVFNRILNICVEQNAVENIVGNMAALGYPTKGNDSKRIGCRHVKKCLRLLYHHIEPYLFHLYPRKAVLYITSTCSKMSVIGYVMTWTPILLFAPYTFIIIK